MSVPVVGSPSQALRKGRSQNGIHPNGLGKKPERFCSIEPIQHRPTLIPVAKTLNPLEIKSLGFDPRKSKDTIASKEKGVQDEFSKRGTAIAKQQCLAINLVTLLHQVLKVEGSKELMLPPTEEVFQKSDDAILLLLQSHYTQLYQKWRATERERLLPGLSALMSAKTSEKVVAAKKK
eukprot:TRINITY_DN8028_c0_g1_i1.p1 TRINITY_DN8028_c0_g1~~TRINITY_DN8028_c0_g1_i1.p1  ORF type:complete len:178 (+),score=40.35 TRINITY_DN8028_c0_g1_i1:166-699(+)